MLEKKLKLYYNVIRRQKRQFLLDKVIVKNF